MKLTPALVAIGLLAGVAPAQRVALRVGTAHLVDGGEVLRGGVTVLVEGGRIAAIGADLDLPADAEWVDYGPDSVLIPGLVAPESSLVRETPSARTADPNLRAIDGFDFYAENPAPLAAGVTSAYIAPAHQRLIAGQGAVVKLAGSDAASRVLAAPATVHGAISAEARRTSGYWEPPIPATSDVGIGVPLEQLPRTTMGAIVALRELMALVESGEDAQTYGPGVAKTLGALIAARVPWRVTAREEDELRALLSWQADSGIPLVVHGADAGGRVADLLAAAEVTVIYESAFWPNRNGVDRGKSPDAQWPDYSTPAALAAAGVPVAISGRGSWDQRFAAALASRGGLDEATALRAITLTPAEAYGVADRIGSITVGKDADLCVLNGAPLDVSTSPLATWVGGEVAWEAESSDSVVIEVEELHVGDGRTLRPGQLLVEDGIIVEVGEHVAHPAGSRVVRGFAAMPGVVDALGHLGLEGSKKVPATDFALARVVGPGDAADRRVARSGITTVCMSPRDTSSSGAPILAYKPAAGADQRQIVRDPVALRLAWGDKNRYESGDKVRDVLEKAQRYHESWAEYDRELAEWKRNPPPAKGKSDKDEDEDKDDSDSEEDEDEDDEKDDDEEEVEEPEAITGLWEGPVERPPFSGTFPVRLRLQRESEDEVTGTSSIRGSLRCAVLSDDLVAVEGWMDGNSLSLRGLGTQGYVRLDLEHAEPEKPKKKKSKKKDDDEEEPTATLTGTIKVAGDEVAVTLKRTATDYPVAARPGPKLDEAEQEKPPKGMPKPPRVDSKLEPLRRAIDGHGTVVVEVDREDEIRECVEAFRSAGIRPVLLGAKDAHRVAREIAPHISGVLPTQPSVVTDRGHGIEKRNRYAELQSAGIAVAFASLAEEGAADLPLMAAFAISQGMSPAGALRALTMDAARMFSIEDRVGSLERGRDADVLLMDGSPFDPRSSVRRVWVNGAEVH